MSIKPEELDAIEARAKAATAGPWVTCQNEDGTPLVCHGEQRGGPLGIPHDGGLATEAHCGIVEMIEVGHDGDLAFVAHAREDVPRLVAEIRTLWKGPAKWEADHHQRALKGIDEEYGTKLAEEFHWDCDNLEVMAERLIDAREEVDRLKAVVSGLKVLVSTRIESAALVCDRVAAQRYAQASAMERDPSPRSPSFPASSIVGAKGSEAEKCAGLIRGMQDPPANTAPRVFEDEADDDGPPGTWGQGEAVGRNNGIAEVCRLLYGLGMMEARERVMELLHTDRPQLAWKVQERKAQERAAIRRWWMTRGSPEESARISIEGERCGWRTGPSGPGELQCTLKPGHGGDCVMGLAQGSLARLAPEHAGTKGDVLSEQLRVPQDSASGVSAVFGKWPGDETDEQVDDALKRRPLDSVELVRKQRDEEWD